MICILIAVAGFAAGWLLHGISGATCGSTAGDRSASEERKTRPIAARPATTRPDDSTVMKEKENGRAVGDETIEVSNKFPNGTNNKESSDIQQTEDSKLALSNPDLSPETLEELRVLFSQAAEGGQDDIKFMQSLTCYKPSVVLGATKAIMRYGAPKEKENALWAVGMLFGKESSTGVPMELSRPKESVVADDGAFADIRNESAKADTAKTEVRTDDQPSTQTDTNGETPNASNNEGIAAQTKKDANGDDGGSQKNGDGDSEARNSHDVIEAVTAGLFDENANVRDTAFEVMRALPDSESGALAANLFSDGESDLQERLLEAVRGSDSDFDIRLSLMGMGSETETVRRLAAENIKTLAGQEFFSQQEAAEWYETHHQEFLHNAGNATPETGNIQ